MNRMKSPLPGHPVQEEPQGVCGKPEYRCPGALLRSLSPESWGSAFVHFIPVYQVLTQTVSRPCSGRTFIRSPWGKEAAVVTPGRVVVPSRRQAVQLAESQVSEKQSKETEGFHTTPVPRALEVSLTPLFL